MKPYIINSLGETMTRFYGDFTMSIPADPFQYQQFYEHSPNPVICERDVYTKGQEKDLNWREQWSNSDNFFKELSYNFFNDWYITSQMLTLGLTSGGFRENELTGGRAFTNIDGTTNYKAGVSIANTLSSIIPVSQTVKSLGFVGPKGLGFIKPMNASVFSQTFKGTALSSAKPAVRGIINRSINEGINYWNNFVPTGRIVIEPFKFIPNQQ